MDPLERSVEQAYEKIDQLNNLSGIYRAKVIETNDPLHIRRIRIRIPMFHNDGEEGVPDELCPWALVVNSFGGNGSGQWNNYSIGDTVFVTFENGDPYSPVVIGAADPTMINLQPLESEYHDFKVLAKDPNNDIRKDKDLSDYYKNFYYYNIADYIPKDRRPMSIGFKDRYGSFLIFNSTGFFPDEHKNKPRENYTKTVFEKNKKSGIPEINQPDSKFIALVSKYGNYLLLADQGYFWYHDPKDLQNSTADDGTKQGEFKGNLWEDYEFETRRSVSLLKLFNEDITDIKPGSPETPEVGNLETHDQRRIELRTRYGHMIQMRDVGWNKSRDKEYSDGKRIISRSITGASTSTELWLKLKTKGGHLFEMIDTGFDLENDRVINTPLQKENPRLIDGEHEFGDDARMIRMVTRGVSDFGKGSKIVLDDRVIAKKPDYNYGILIKTSRQSSDKINRGFGIELSDIYNHMQLYSPEKQCIEFNDDNKSIILASGLKDYISQEYKGKTDNRFNELHIDPEGSFHIKLNSSDNKRLISIKTPLGNEIKLKDADSQKYINIKGNEDRGIYISSTDKVVSIRNNNEDRYIVIDDDQGTVIIYSAKKIQIYAEDDIEFYSKNNIKFKSEKSIILTGSMESIQIGDDLIASENVDKGNPQYAKRPDFIKPKLKPPKEDEK